MSEKRLRFMKVTWLTDEMMFLYDDEARHWVNAELEIKHGDPRHPMFAVPREMVMMKTSYATFQHAVWKITQKAHQRRNNPRHDSR